MRSLPAVLFAAAAAANGQPSGPGRFEPVAPLPELRWARLDRAVASYGVANGMARSRGLQGRMLWIDGTANIEAVNSEEKARALMERIARTGFNTVVYDVKPIVGRTLYPSRIAPRMTSWRGQALPEGYDPLDALLRHARANGLQFFVSMNAFAEGHQFAKRAEDDPSQDMGDPGYGYSRPDLQTVRYMVEPALAGPMLEEPLPLHRQLDPTGLEAGRGQEGTPQAGVYSRVPNGVRTPCGSAVLDRAGRVLSTHVGLPESLPEGATLVVGLDGAGERVASALPGDRLRVASLPRFVPIGEAQNQIPLMMNPHHPEVLDRAERLVREVVGAYAVDGFLYDDRLRYAGMDADFSEQARLAFEAWVGRPVRLPDDVFATTFNWRMEEGARPGPLYDAWLAFRAKTLSDWVARVGAAVRESRPSALFGVYAGSTYSDYPKFGSNYGSPGTLAGYPFLTQDYRAQGFASRLDLVVTGCYYRYGTVYEAMEAGVRQGFTVEAAAVVSNRVVRDEAWVYAGIMLSNFWDDPSRLETSLQAAVSATQGVMVFDLSHRMEDFWPILERAFRKRAKPPHAQTGLLEAVRRERARLDASGAKEPPFPIYDGMAGAGF